MWPMVGNLGRELVDPGEVGVVPEPRLLRVHAGPHRRPRRRADRDGAVRAVEAHALRLQPLAAPGIARPPGNSMCVSHWSMQRTRMLGRWLPPLRLPLPTVNPSASGQARLLEARPEPDPSHPLCPAGRGIPPAPVHGLRSCCSRIRGHLRAHRGAQGPLLRRLPAPLTRLRGRAPLAAAPAAAALPGRTEPAARSATPPTTMDIVPGDLDGL